jgi:hypothetical protein
MIAILISDMTWFEVGRLPFDLPLPGQAFETSCRRDLSEKLFYKIFQRLHDYTNLYRNIGALASARPYRLQPGFFGLPGTPFPTPRFSPPDQAWGPLMQPAPDPGSFQPADA